MELLRLVEQSITLLRTAVCLDALSFNLRYHLGATRKFRDDLLVSMIVFMQGCVGGC